MAPSTPACPRCGYDLSGAIAVWDDACPLTGVCSECGLELEWRRVLNPALTTPKWSFEHAIDRRIRRLLATLAVAMLPWVFWRQLRMEHPIRPRRLLIFAVALLLGAHFACAVAQGWETWARGSLMIESWVAQGATVPDNEPWLSAVRAGLWPYRPYSLGWSGVPAYRIIWMAFPLCLVLGAPLALLLLPDTFKRARVRRMHILRGAIYGLCAPIVAVIAFIAVEAADTIAQLRTFGPPSVWAELLSSAVALTALIWYILWWWFFTRRYLQLPRGWLVAILILIIAALLAVTVAVKLAGVNVHTHGYLRVEAPPIHPSSFIIHHSPLTASPATSAPQAAAAQAAGSAAPHTHPRPHTSTRSPARTAAPE